MLCGSRIPKASDLILLAKASRRSYYKGDLQEILRSFLVSRPASVLFCISPFCVSSGFSAVLLSQETDSILSLNAEAADPEPWCTHG